MLCRICEKPIQQLQGRQRTRCNACNTTIRRYRTKEAAVKLLGGECQDCGWQGNAAAFDFHHEGGKDFTIGGAANKSWDVVKRELEKCTLLCSNCHRIKHSSRTINPRIIEEAEGYKGRLLE